MGREVQAVIAALASAAFLVYNVKWLITLALMNKFNATKQRNGYVPSSLLKTNVYILNASYQSPLDYLYEIIRFNIFKRVSCFVILRICIKAIFCRLKTFETYAQTFFILLQFCMT